MVRYDGPRVDPLDALRAAFKVVAAGCENEDELKGAFFIVEGNVSPEGFTQLELLEKRITHEH